MPVRTRHEFLKWIYMVEIKSLHISELCFGGFTTVTNYM